MNNVRKSICRLITAVVASAMMVVSSGLPAMAANDYTTQVCQKASNGSGTGVTLTAENGVITSERTIFKQGAVSYKANTETGYWEVTDTTNGVSNTPAGNGTSIVTLDKKLSTGIAQAKFTFNFLEGNEPAIRLTFSGFAGEVGIQINRGSINITHPNGGATGKRLTNRLELNTDYVMIVTLDMNSNVLSWQCNGESGSYQYTDANMNGYTKDAVKELIFQSGRDRDFATSYADAITETTVDGTKTYTGKEIGSNPTVSKWQVSNISYNAFTETNYELSEIYRSENGLNTNQKIDGYTYKGLTANKLTDFVAPGSVKLLTAVYDSATNRMIDVSESDPSALVGTYTEPTVAEGTYVKKFIIDKDSVRPYANALTVGTSPTKRVRTIDFESGFPETITGGVGSDSTYKVGYANDLKPVNVKEGDNHYLEITRKAFNYGNTNYTKGDYWYNDETGLWELRTGTGTNTNAWKLNFKMNNVNSYKLSYRVKFGGTTTSARQEVYVSTDDTDKHSFSLNRKADGTWSCQGDNNTDKILENEWYTFTVDYAVNPTSTETDASGNPKYNTTCTISLTGNFSTGEKTIVQTKTGTTTASPTINSLSIRDRRGAEYGFSIPATQTAFSRTPASWYIDDITIID